MTSKADEIRQKLADQEEAFKKKQKQLKARLQIETARERRTRDKVETHVKVIAGAIAFELCEQDTAVHKKMEHYLQGYLESRPGDWPYFEKFPARKSGGLLFKLKQPAGWHELMAARRASRKSPAAESKDKSGKDDHKKH